MNVDPALKTETNKQASLLDDPLKSLSAGAELTNFQVYKRLLSYAFVFWGAFLLSILGHLIFASTMALNPMLLEKIIDSIGQPRSAIHTLLPLLIVALFILRGSGSFLGTYCMDYVSRNVVHNIRVEMFSKVIRLPHQFFINNPPGHLVSRLTYTVDQVAGASGNALTVFVREGLTVIGLFAYLFYQNWQLTLVFLVILPPIAAVVQYASKRFRKLGKSIQHSMGDVTQVSSEVFNAYQEVKVYGAGQYEDERFRSTSHDNYRYSMKLALTRKLIYL